MTDDAFDVDAYVLELRAKREEKNDFFESHPQSPIPPEERDDFNGLDYFGPGPDYRVTASAETYADPEPMTMDISTDGEARYLRVTTLHFEFRDTDFTLDAYRQERDDPSTLFILLRDKTTERQVYNGGRYMELTPDTPLDELGEVVVDFSPAYNPFCVSTEAFGCPLSPGENWLDVIVPAGKRDYE